MTGPPTGRAGRALAASLTLLALVLLWLGVVAPGLAWYTERAERLAGRTALAARMQALADTLPALRQEAARLTAAGPAEQALLGGATDAIAGATLQEAVQDLATRAGVTVSSAEMLPAEPAGRYRRIGLKVTLSAPWPSTTALLAAIAQAVPQMMVADLAMQRSVGVGAAESRPVQAAFTVFAMQAGQGGGR